MTPVQLIRNCGFLACSAAIALAEPVASVSYELPAAASHTIDFEREIKPIFEVSCIQCHGRGKAAGRFSLEDRAVALRGGVSGPAIVPGDSADSYLIELVAGVDPVSVMPQRGTRLTDEEVGVLRAWIDQGANWPESIEFGRAKALNLEPRRPELPPVAGGREHPVDRWLGWLWAGHGDGAVRRVDDGQYARRVYLDVIGLLPTPTELDAFVTDREPDKRKRLVRRLLEEDRRYAEHWLTFWNDALRNDYRGTGYIDGGRQPITGWLYAALASNLPFDQFVRELVNPGPRSEGFTKGIVWRGVVNASQTPEMQAAQNVSQVFMGVNLKCASCHDSFIDDWTLADAYGLAGVYADGPLEMVLCDKPTGDVAPLKFIYPELGDLDPSLPRAARLERLADLMTREENGRLTRTMVNRLWARFMGRGLVEPLDDMEQPSWHPDLLDWLAADLVDHNYDLKRTIELILTSQAYQLPAVPVAELDSEEYVFRGPLIRRMTAEQYLDAISSLTGVWHLFPEAKADFDIRSPDADPPRRPLEARWIWTSPDAAHQAPPGTVYWRRAFSLGSPPTEAALVIAADNRFTVFVNGREIAGGSNFRQPRLLDLKPYLVAGTNLLAVRAVNDPNLSPGSSATGGNPAGVIAYAHLRNRTEIRGVEREEVLDLATDRHWRWSLEPHNGWTSAEFDDAGWGQASELGPADIGPWRIEEPWQIALSSASLYGQVRAALVSSDPLMTALGRPNREQVITSRPTVATTLEALELTNGETLARWLQRGAERWMTNRPSTAEGLIVELYRRALGRVPTDAELQLAGEWVGMPMRTDGVEDLLWALTMLPEFQLIY
jgi:mono/diheme cytochrome c family protein